MKQINKAAVLGAGVMGAAIAAHLANAGVKTLLLDIVPKELNDAEKKAGLSPGDRAVRNRFASAGLEGLKKANPAALYLPSFISFIEPGNFDDDAAKLRECDWVIEAVVENMEIKKKLLSEKVGPNLREDAVFSTNTSGLSVEDMSTALPPAARRNFLVTHFFNPPRYMRLVEIVPCKETDPEVVRFMDGFISKRLGKGIVYAKNTPNFIANRIGVFSMCGSMRHMTDMNMTVEEVDAVAGPATAKPKSAAFRTADLVGLDTLLHVANNSYELLPRDEQREVFKLPGFVGEMVKKGLLGNKTRQGFYKKEKTETGDEYFHYDYTTGGYAAPKRVKYASVEAAKAIDDPGKRLVAVLSGADKGAEFAWRTMRDTLLYSVNRIPEIADDIVNIDNAMKWGFNWELGPFEMLDAIGVRNFVERAEKDGVTVPPALKAVERFYRFDNGKDYYLAFPGTEYREVPRPAERIDIGFIKKTRGVVEQNSGASILDLGDGVYCLEFHAKMNAIGNEIITMIQKATKRAEQEGAGLVIANEGTAFSAGANLMLVAMAIAEGAYDDLGLYVRNFQKTMMAIKYSKIPVVAAPHNLVLGGGCEICLHADSINAHAETYMGLVEAGVGLLPAGGGTKEMALRAIKLAEAYETDVTPFITRGFRNIAMAKVSASAAELFGMGYLRHGDAVSMDRGRRVHDAKQRVLHLASTYRPSLPLTELKAPGRSIAASIKSTLWNMKVGGQITAYEEVIGGAIADVITGGDVPAGTPITEEYLLDLEREAFLKLCRNKQTLERIQYMLKKGKPLRN